MNSLRIELKLIIKKGVMVMLFSNSSDPLHSVSWALDKSLLKHRVYSENIANADTPDYKRREVTFQDHLTRAKSVEGVRTDPKHRLSGTKNQKFPELSVTRDTATSLRVDGNNVDIDREMTRMSKNALNYEALTQMASRRFERLQRVLQQR